ncbi:MAG: zinc-binding dehydrogenase [Saprospiraceae bacterium]|nr:zinc-binding dehydrogenase [Saprospiraceae bacterium]
MRAWIFNAIGEKPVLSEFTDAGYDQWLKVKVKASALNHRDLWIVKGKYPKIVTQVILGSDGAGEVNGKSVVIQPGWYWGNSELAQSSRFRVLGMPDHGTFAEYIYVPQEYCHIKPEHLSFEAAAALPLAGLTAYRALVVKCQPVAGQKVLITGIGGGVALFAMQFALASGCQVFVTSGSDDKIQKAINIGASGGVNYKDEDWPDKLMSLSGGVDIIIDSAGGAGFSHFVKLCNPGAKIAFYGATLGPFENLNPQPFFWKQLTMFGSTMGSDQDFINLLDFVTEHKIQPVIDNVFLFEELDKGFDRLESGHHFGKIVFRH